LNQPLIIDSLPPQQVLVWIIKVLFSFNLVFSYPLIIHPANNVLESYLFGSWKKSKKRQWSKNVSRTIIVFISCVVSIFVWDNLDKFLSVVGALTCTPIAFTLPTWFHLKVSAKTDFERRSDKVLIGLSLVIMVWCTFYAFYTWND
jgi:amino acid permease